MRLDAPAGLDDGAASEIEAIANATELEVRAELPGLSRDLTLVVKTGGFVIPETGETGAAVAPGRVEWTVDPDRPEGIVPIAQRHLRHTLFHELHHQVRGWVMVGGAPVTTFMTGVVAEGLATAFARDASGEDAPWAEYPDDVEDWARELSQLPVTANYVHWMFQHPDGRRWIGYRTGTYIADRAIRASGRSAAELVTTPTEVILDLAGIWPVN